MKKAIIILTILNILLIGFTAYIGKNYIEVLDILSNKSKEKSALIDKKADLENNLNLSEYQYNYDIDALLKNDKGCSTWLNLNETLKQIKK